MRTLNRLALGAVLVLAACGESNDPPPPPPTLDGPITLSATSMWAGETLTLASADFAQVGVNDSVIVAVGGSQVRATRVDETHFSFNVPADRGGTFDVKVQWRGLEQDAPRITLYGFDRVDFTNYRFWSDLTVVQGAEPRIIAIDAGTPFVVVMNVVNGAAEIATVPMTFDFCRGAGPTPEPGVFLLQKSGAGMPSALERWRLVPTIQLLDTLPGVECRRQIMQMSPHRLFRSFHHDYQVLARPDSNTAFSQMVSVRAEETEGVALSPRGDRASIQIDIDVNGVPVFDAASGLIAWRATSLRGTFAAEFSSDGNRLLLVGPDSAHSGGGWGVDTPGQRVEVRNATNGVVIAARSFDRALMGATFDPSANLIYVILAEVREPGISNAPTILVLKGTSLETVAHLRLPPTAPACQNGCYHAVAAVSAEPAIYVVASQYDSPATAVRWRYTLPPLR